MGCPCKKCQKDVIDGFNGYVSEAPPWAPEGTPPEAYCYGCENEDIDDAEDRRQEDQIEAALRAGRLDCV